MRAQLVWRPVGERGRGRLVVYQLRRSFQRQYATEERRNIEAWIDEALK